jgi:hypothetical protein
VEVADNNAPPVFASSPLLTATEGMTYRYDIRATDPDGDLLRYALDEGPTGMELDVGQTGGQSLGGVFGRLTWAPGAGTAGNHQVRVRAVDPRGLSAVQEFDVTVQPDGEAPRVNLTLSRDTTPIGEA